MSLAATPRPTGTKTASARTAGNRVTMIARLLCWCTLFSYAAALALELLGLYGS